MTAPPKDNLENHPQLPDNRVLHPLFGNFCTTETFSLKTHVGGSHHTHYEAHLDDPVKKTWTVSKVVTVTEDSFHVWKRKSTTGSQVMKAKLNFRDALKLMGQLEKDHKDKPHNFETLYPRCPRAGIFALPRLCRARGLRL